MAKLELFQQRVLTEDTLIITEERHVGCASNLVAVSQE